MDGRNNSEQWNLYVSPESERVLALEKAKQFLRKEIFMAPEVQSHRLLEMGIPEDVIIEAREAVDDERELR